MQNKLPACLLPVLIYLICVLFILFTFQKVKNDVKDFLFYLSFIIFCFPCRLSSSVTMVTETFITPVITLPKVLELVYYANSLFATFACEGVLGKQLVN